MDCFMRCENCWTEFEIAPSEASNSEYHQSCEQCGIGLCNMCKVEATVSDGVSLYCHGCASKLIELELENDLEYVIDPESPTDETL